MKWRWALLVTLVILVTPVGRNRAQESTPSQPQAEAQVTAPPPACEVWSVKGMRVGMTLSDFKKANPKARLARGSYLQTHVKEGQWWFAKKKDDYRVYALPLEDYKADFPLICFNIQFDIPSKQHGITTFIPEVSPKSIVEELRRRWGDPIESEKEAGGLQWYTGFGVPKGGTKIYRSTWVNEACDTVAVAERTASTYPLQTENLIVWLRSKTRMIDPLQEAEEERAKKALESSGIEEPPDEQ